MEAAIEDPEARVVVSRISGLWWLWLVFLLAVPAAVIVAGEWGVGVLRRGLRPEAELPNLRLLLDCAGPGPTVPVTITRFRGLRPWWPVLVPAVAVVDRKSVV